MFKANKQIVTCIITEKITPQTYNSLPQSVQKTTDIPFTPTNYSTKGKWKKWDSIWSQHCRIKTTSLQIHSDILHITTFKIIWAPKSNSAASVLSIISTVNYTFLTFPYQHLIYIMSFILGKSKQLHGLSLTSLGRLCAT